MIEKAPEFEFNDNIDKVLWILFANTHSDLIQKIEKEYLYWDKVKYYNEEKVLISNEKKAIDPKSLWTRIKLQREIIQKNAFSIISPDNNFDLVKYNINEYLQESLHYLDFNFGAGLQKEQLLSELEKIEYLNNALMEESIFSSMIEGATTTRVKAKEMLLKNKKPKDKSEQMILNNYKTTQYISEHQDKDITKENLVEIHRLVTEDTLEEENVGVYRNNNEVNVVNEITGEIVHTPPSFEQLNELMDSLYDFFNNNPKDDFIHPIVKASILHFLIGYIHPFVDGNGRTARAIFYWYLLKNGYWLTEYLSISRVIMKTKVQYEKAYLYTEIDDMDVTYFIHYQVKVLVRAFENLKKYVAKKKKEENQLLKFLQLEEINERQAKILKKIEEDANRFFTVKEIENTFGVTNQTARTDIEELVEKDFLKKVRINKKSYNYWKSENFDKLISK